MNAEYTYPKKQFKKKDVNIMWLFFNNSDYISLNGSEIVDLEIKLYDRLIWGERGVCPVAESGFIKLNVSKINKAIYNGSFLYNEKQYRRDRKGYIEHRCVEEGGMKCVRLFDELSWYDTIYGNIVGEIDGKYLILKFLSQPHFSSAGCDESAILLNPLAKSKIDSIDLDFENCEHFTIYKDEIQNIHIEFEKELEWGAGDLLRKVKSGFIKFKFDKDVGYRRAYFLDDKKITVKKLERRLCGKGLQSEHDICHLYVDYEYAGFGSYRNECIKVEDIRSDEELERIDKLEEEEYFLIYDYIGGYCKKLSDGSILITFGKNSEELLKKFS